MNTLVKKLLDYADMEEKYAVELRDLGSSLKHPVLRSLFISIAKDSEKHGMIYRALAELASNPQPFITEDELKRVVEVVKRHIETESKMLESVKLMLEETNDPRFKLLLEAIREDEAKHHALLASIRDKLAAAETLREQELWDMIWKESPWHGTPGG